MTPAKRVELGPWYSPKQAAPLLGVKDEDTVRAMCVTGELAAKREGRVWLIPESAIGEYNAARMTGPGWDRPALAAPSTNRGRRAAR